ncbi:hypothetical protein [Enhydrobacter sp.]|jgi:hypothetical protein|uniref:hypothetical protein n=1 Tax=Enhydrobacter sp. TaxID=1894999 RepID=UPI0026393B55|nr:hypothetical protein [Enhydrobacter sp.]WIM13566.1 MAG: hypothetical protein OJF58_004534 [Enhydrobacter sp.]
MPGESTLIVTTRSGVRPLGVRGEPLHNSAIQLGRIVRRRLGNEIADLLAEPQLHADGKGIDWYANWAGEVRNVADLDPKERGEILSQVDRGLIAIDRLGQSLAGAGSGEDTGAVGRSLRLAARRPAESFVFLVGGRPVVVCWGYEKEAASSLLPPSLARPAATRRSVLDPPKPLPVAAPIVGPTPIPWFRTMLLALPLLALLLVGVWMLRDLLPATPALALATREPPAASPPPAAPADPRPILKASLSHEQARAKALQIEMSTIEGELKKRIADCKPPAPPAPPRPPSQAAIAPPAKPVPPPRAPSDNRLRLPTGPTRDYSFLEGCWRSDPFRHERMQLEPGVSSYCFDANGYGQLEWRRGRVACRTAAQARFDGQTLRLHDRDTTCNDGSHWFADQLVCRRGADNVAQCSGYSRGTFGPTTWTVNLHKLR